VIARGISITTILVFLEHDRNMKYKLDHNLHDFPYSIQVSSFSSVQAFVTLIYHCARQSWKYKDKLIKLHFISQYVRSLSIAAS